MTDFPPLKVFLESNSDWCPEGRIRWWIHCRETNGIERSGAIVKKLGRWYVDVPKLREWLKAGDEAA